MAFPSLRAKLSLASWLETHTEFRLPLHSKNLQEALEYLAKPHKPSSYVDQFCHIKRTFNRIILGLLVICFALGLMAVPPAFTINQTNQVNVFWLLVILLGFHALNLLTWFAMLMATASYKAESKGIILTSLMYVSQKISKHLPIKNDVTLAFLNWQCHPHTNKWLISTLTHSAWSCYLIAGWLMTLLLLLTNQINFVWETTLLTDQAFVRLTEYLSALPSWFGVTVPSQLDILTSRVDTIVQSDTTRQHWASFLLASLMLYGVIPRLILTTLCYALYRFKRVTQPLSTQEKMIKNRYQEDRSQNSKVIDKDEHSNQTKVLDEEHLLKELPKSAFQARWLAFEWSDIKPEELSSVIRFSYLNSREKQSQFLNLTDTNPVYLLVNGEQSPDRGIRRFFSQAKIAYPALCMVISNGNQAKFVRDWQRLGLESGVPQAQIQKKD